MKMSLKNKDWKEFVIADLFNTKIGKNVDGNKVNKKTGKTAYITRKESNNGLDGFVDFNKEYLNVDRPVITIGNETAEPFVQKFPFFTGTKVNILIPKLKLSERTLLFITQSLRMHKSKYSYSFTINSNRLKKQIILLPTTLKGNPDYAFMEAYMREKEQERVKAYKNYITKKISKLGTVKNVASFKDKEWEEFSLNDVFLEIQRGKRLKKGDHKKGKMPYVSSSAMNNGVDNYIGNKEKNRIFSNCLSIANSGSVGSCFYQPFKFVASDHVTKLENKELSKYTLLFISTIATRLGEKYSFNREINDTRIKREKILLPVNKEKEPDYQFMEHYMKRLELNKLRKYLDYTERKTV